MTNEPTRPGHCDTPDPGNTASASAGSAVDRVDGTVDGTDLDYVVEACATLIRFDTSNFGGGRSHGEREAAEWVADQLTGFGFNPQVYESEPGRASTVVRIVGTDRDAPALLMHGHLDVVPAEADDWSCDPFGGELRDGAVWGRGALDMKDMDALMLTCARSLGRTPPPRDVVLAFVADEEDTGQYGAGYLVAEHADLFEGVTTAIGESGAYTVFLPDGSAVYPIATGERGTAWMDLTAHGPAGHGSRPHPDNAVVHLSAALARIGAYRWPTRLNETTGQLLAGLCDRLGIEIDPDDRDSLSRLGDAARLLEATMSNSANPSMLSAGYKHNVIPSAAVAGLDGRTLPGLEDEFLATIDELLGDRVSRRLVNHTAPIAASPDTPAYAAMAAAVTAHEPEALVLPFCLGGGTDAKWFAELGIDCYGFTPARTPPGFQQWDYVHGVDEHVLIDSLRFGVGVLDTFVRTPTSLACPPGAG